MIDAERFLSMKPLRTANRTMEVFVAMDDLVRSTPCWFGWYMGSLTTTKFKFLG